MNTRNIRIKVEMMNSLEDLIGLTITEANSDDSDYSIVICGDKAILTIKEYESGSCGDRGYEYLEVSTDPMGELGVETCHSLGLLNEEDYQKYKKVNAEEIRKKQAEIKRRQKEKEDIAASNKKAEDYKKYMELKNQFEKTN